MIGKNIELSSIILDIAAGPFGSKLKVSNFVEKGFPIIDGANLKSFKVTDNITKFVTKEKATSLYRSIAKRRDVVVTISGTLGQISYIPDNSLYPEYLCSQRQFRVTFDQNKVYIPYIVFYFHTYEGKHKILSFANQTGVPALSQPLKNFKKINIFLPPLSKQIKVGTFIENINSKIELNTKINDNLAQQIQNIYNELFITNAKSSWQRCHLCDLIKVKYGKDHRKLADGIYPVFGSGGLMRKVDRPLYEKESVLIPRKGSLNNIMYVNEPFWSVDTMFYTEMKLPNIAKFIYHFIKSLDLASMNAGSAVPSMTVDILNSIELFKPDNKSLEFFESIASKIYLKIFSYSKESENLSELRDLLLPKLISGELDISEIKF